MLEGYVKVLVQHKIAQLLARQWRNELSTIVLILAIGARSRHALFDLRLAHANDASE